MKNPAKVLEITLVLEGLLPVNHFVRNSVPIRQTFVDSVPIRQHVWRIGTDSSTCLANRYRISDKVVYWAPHPPPNRYNPRLRWQYSQSPNAEKALNLKRH